MKHFLLSIILVVVAIVAKAQAPQLLNDSYTGTNQIYGAYNLYFGAMYNGKYYYNINDSIGYVLYATDGTAAGTQLIKRVPQIVNLIVYNNDLYFGFIDAALGASLWKTNGTVAGTQLIKSFGGTLYAPHSFYVVNNKLIFCTSKYTTGDYPKQLYVTDGTATGTTILDSTLYDMGFEYGGLNGKAIFSASATKDTSYLKKELYITDGTTAGTTLVKDITAGSAGSNPSGFINYNGKVYFGANNGITGTELYVTDGTGLGTYMVKDINTGSAESFFSLRASVHNGKLYFGANNGINGAEPWLSDGTAAGTQLLTDVNSGNSGSFPASFLSFNNKLFFNADDGIHGYEIWTSDGVSNTSLLMDINSGANSGVYSLMPQNIMCGSKLYFDAQNTNNNIEPWITDGTTANTTTLGEINPSASYGSLDFETRFVQINGKVLFRATSPLVGSEVFYVNETCIPASLSVSSVNVATIYPNPTNDAFTIVTTNVGETLIITDLAGKQVYSTALTSVTQQINAELNAGIYLVKVGNNKIQKLIVE
ncbi:MAG: T9SS type A sorting domain-containing protein [Bacteroidia bacterium]|nr:T9SS type A sorting domain-containing protein [Bacteroidia bacterium]